MSYQIQILSDSEFDNLPYPEVDISLGLADPRSKTAYVRYTQSDDLNKYLINHELEHLIEAEGGVHSDHYRNGVYYKGFGNLFGQVARSVSPQNKGSLQTRTRLIQPIQEGYDRTRFPVGSFPSQNVRNAVGSARTRMPVGSFPSGEILNAVPGSLGGLQ